MNKKHTITNEIKMQSQIEWNIFIFALSSQLYAMNSVRQHKMLTKKQITAFFVSFDFLIHNYESRVDSFIQ